MAFHYKVGPGANGALTTRPSLQGTKTTDEFIQILMQRTGQSQAAATALLQAACETFIDLAKDTYRVEPLFGLLALTPTSGGSAETDAFTGTLDNIHAGFSIFMGKEGNLRFAHNFTATRDGEQGYKTAIVDRVTNKATGSPDSYTPQKGLLIEGSGLRVNAADAETGVFLRAATGGGVVRVAQGDYLVNDPSKLLVLMPAGLTGDQTLIIKTHVIRSLRTFTYSTPLQYSLP